jgi:hypothetical protein
MTDKLIGNKLSKGDALALVADCNARGNDCYKTRIVVNDKIRYNVYIRRHGTHKTNGGGFWDIRNWDKNF